MKLISDHALASGGCEARIEYCHESSSSRPLALCGPERPGKQKPLLSPRTFQKRPRLKGIARKGIHENDGLFSAATNRNCIDGIISKRKQGGGRGGVGGGGGAGGGGGGGGGGAGRGGGDGWGGGGGVGGRGGWGGGGGGICHRHA